jgi:DNA-directed RNA polymerase subunit beta'
MKEIIDNKENASNSFVTMIKSGARGNIAQFTSILGMRGLMNKAYNYEKAAKTKVVKDTIETPITHSLLEGVSSLEFFNASFGSRKAQADIQLKTSKSGYMTRKLVDCAQEIVVTQDDCHPLEGLVVTDLYNKDGKVSATLESRIIGRYAFEDVVDASNKVLVAKDELITEELAEKITKAGIKEVSIRSPIHCKCKTGVCQKCYGLDLTNNKLVKIGEPVGVVAGQSIGEPSTQLNMRSKQTGGLVGAGGNIAQGFERLAQLLDVVSPKPLELAKIATVGGTINSIIETEDGFDVVISADITNEMVTIKSEKNKNILVKTGDVVKRGQMLFKGSINLKTLLEVSGIEAVRQYLLSELQNIYKSQGIDVNDKYLEIIISQMTNKVRVLTNNEQYDLFIGKIINSKKLEEINEKLLTDARKSPIIAKPIVISVDDVPDNSSSFFSSASFQYSKQVLSHACISGEVDFLKGLKENVMLGGLIPAGTGLLSDTDELFKGAEEAYNKE